MPSLVCTEHPRPADQPTGSPPDAAALAEVVAAARTGSPDAWAELFARFNHLMLAIARRHGLPAAEYEDIAQVTWMRLLENIDRIRNDAALAGWLVTTSTRETYARSRRLAREIPSPEAHLVTDPVLADDVDAVLDELAAAAMLRRYIRRLPDRERRLMELLIDPSEPSYRQISLALGMPVGAIGPVRQRAIRRLQGWFGVQGTDDEGALALEAS
jgi:RNA polymerase sigma factor (sigma-70 family)